MSRIYVGFTLIFGASAVTAALLPVSEFIRGMIAVPGVGALCGAVFTLVRDHAEFQRKQHLQLDQQIFSLGASSHMAETAFAKHVEFCERYMTAVHEAITTLFREGPSEKASDCANTLFAIKREFAAWVPKSMAIKLEPFEDALYRIGVERHLAEATINSPDNTRKLALEASYALFKKVLQLEKIEGPDNHAKEDVAAENVKERIREILGINELVEIRTFIIERSAEFTRRRT